MADSFFGLEADTPVLGAGEGADDGLDEFDDQIDLMNDQTFGEAATTEDWENEHEKLTADDSPLVRGQNGNHKSNSPQHDLEASLRQLVVDDEDDGSAVHRGRAIPKMSSNLSDLFGPSSPSGLLNTEELIRGHENIWGSPVRDSPMSRGPPQMRPPNMPHNLPQHFLQQQGEEGFKGLLHQMHQTYASPPPSNAPKSLFEIERDLMRPEPSPPHSVRKNSRAMTLEELERELTGEQAAPPVHILRRPTSPPNLPLPIGTPPQQQHFPPSNQPLPGFSPRVPPPGWTGPPPPIAKHGSPSMPPGLSGRVDSPNNFRPHHDQYPSPPSPASPPPAIVSLLLSAARHFFPSRHASLSPTSLTASDLKALIVELLKCQKNPGSNGAGRWPSDANDSRGSPPFHRPPPGHEHFRSQHHQNDIRQQFFNAPPMRQPGFNQGPPHRGRGPMDPRGGMNRGIMRGRGGHFGPYQHRPHFQQHDDYYRNEDYGEERNGDPYANLMTEREKDWVIKIQLRQLQTDNPYLDDYYYTSMQMKKEAAKSRDRQIDAKLVIPQIARMDKDYKPLTFEGSLGRLTTSSVHNPRRIIDVSSNSLHEIDEAKGREVRRFKKLLLDIEASYDTLLDVDELEKRALALPEEARTAVYEERTQKILHMYEAFHALIVDEEAYCRLLAVRKGVKVIARLLPLLPKDNGVLLASSLLAHLSLISKKEWQKDVLPIVCENMAVLIQCCDLDALVKLSGALSEDSTSDSAISSALQNQFGSSVVWCLVSRGESLYTDVSPVDMEIEHQNAWSKFVQSVTEAVDVLSKDLLAKPSGMPYSGIGRHLERLVDKRALLSVEDKLQSLMADGSQQRAT